MPRLGTRSIVRFYGILNLSSTTRQRVSPDLLPTLSRGECIFSMLNGNTTPQRFGYSKHGGTGRAPLTLTTDSLYAREHAVPRFFFTRAPVGFLCFWVDLAVRREDLGAPACTQVNG